MGLYVCDRAESRNKELFVAFTFYSSEPSGEQSFENIFFGLEEGGQKGCRFVYSKRKDEGK